MANTTISPNMSLPIPTVGVDPGPDWATNVDACLQGVDSHNHSTGQGVQINPSGLNINADLPVNSNNVTLTKSVRFASQSVALSDPADIGCIYEVGADLYYNDGAGNQVRITQGGSVTGSSGTITGLPSGTASASFAASTFTFQSATSTPANLSVGPVTIGTNTASPKTVTIAPNGSQAANYDLTLPLALPGSTSMVNLDSSGNLGAVTPTGSGLAVLNGSPSITAPAISGGGSLAGTFTGNPSFSGNPVFTNAGSPTFSGVTSFSSSGSVTFSAGVTNGGGGVGISQVFKTAIYSGTISSSSSTSFAAPGAATQIVGIFGFWINPTIVSSGPIGQGTPVHGISFGTNANPLVISLANNDASLAAYYVTVFYQ